MDVSGFFAGLWLVAFLGLAALMTAALWQLLVKAGQPGWAALVPVYGALVVLRIAGRPGWWLLWSLIPMVNLLFALIVYLDLVHSFGQPATSDVLFIFLPFVFLPMLAFGPAPYLGPAAARMKDRQARHA